MTMLTDSALHLDDMKSAAASRGPRVALEDLELRIAAKEFHTHGRMTLCILTIVNGFQVLGQSSCADVANFDAQTGREFAYEDAIRKLWELEGYLLRERMHNPLYDAD